ncbi:MAG: exopolysaccharide biosynthesis protein [Acidobacteriia bacterium]|nr:exopolysaccharide biosynthesis protein [Terriglobia bacterium]
MVDIHCHILPGVDDGPETMEESLAMAESAIAQGITHIVATPHASSEYPFEYARVRRERDELQGLVGDRLTLATGCDFHLNTENLQALKDRRERFCINQNNYLLVEFSDYSIPRSMDQTLHDLQLAGLQPIITHPERNSILNSHPERLRQWIEQGCYAQVTAGALIGAFGSAPRRIAETWIAEGLVHFAASDAHDSRRRPLMMKKSYRAVTELFGAEKAQALFRDNPRAALEGQALPHVPPLADKRPAARRKRFFFF